MLYKNLRALLRSERGMETLEYALMAGLIALVALFVYLGAGWRTSLQGRLANSATAGNAAAATNTNSSNGNSGNGQCPLPPCGQPPPCGRPPCGKGK